MKCFRFERDYGDEVEWSRVKSSLFIQINGGDWKRIKVITDVLKPVN